MLTFYSCMGNIREEGGLAVAWEPSYIGQQRGPLPQPLEVLQAGLGRVPVKVGGTRRIAGGRERLVSRPHTRWNLTHRCALFSPPGALNQKIWQHRAGVT